MPTLKNRRGWPKALVVIADAIGDDAALKLIDDMGGTRLRIPSHPRPNSLLSVTLGHAMAQALAEVLAGTDVDIPSAARLRSKKSSILSAINAGGTTRDIARAHGVTMRYVRQLKADAAAEGPKASPMGQRVA